MSFYFQKEISLTSDSFLMDENGDIIYPDYFPIGLNGLKEADNIQEVAEIIKTDPVRGHIPPEFRLGNGARVFYYGEPGQLKAAICMHIKNRTR